MASDATKQSACTTHLWKQIPSTEHWKSSSPEYLCDVCGAKPKGEKQTQQASATVYLRKLLKPGDTVYTVLRSVSRSGMSRHIDFYVIRENEPQWVTAQVGHAIGSPQSRKDWERSAGLSVTGCGMDMGFHCVYTLAWALFPAGYKLAGDHGYALKHKWM